MKYLNKTVIFKTDGTNSNKELSKPSQYRNSPFLFCWNVFCVKTYDSSLPFGQRSRRMSLPCSILLHVCCIMQICITDVLLVHLILIELKSKFTGSKKSPANRPSHIAHIGPKLGFRFGHWQGASSTSASKICTMQQAWSKIEQGGGTHRNLWSKGNGES